MKTELIRKHIRIMFAGFLRTLSSAATIGCFALSVYAFKAIPAASGYLAIAEFVGAIAALCGAFAAMYFAGKRESKAERKGRFAA